MNTQETTQTETQEIPLPQIAPISIDWNGVELVMVPTRETKGPNAGKEVYIAPNRDLTLGELEKILGSDYAVKRLFTPVKSALKDFYVDSINKNGLFDAAKFSANVKNYSFVSISMGDLNDKLATTLGLYLEAPGDTAEEKQEQERLKNQLQVLRLQLNAKKRNKAQPAANEDGE